MAIPAYPERAKGAYAFLYRAYNDIDIYVEDTTTRALYENLFTRILAGRVRLTRVHALGGRKAVLDECDRSQGEDSRARLFIVDGDLDHFTGHWVQQRPHLYQLGVYCSENLVVCQEALESVAFDCAVNQTLDDVRRTLDFSGAIADYRRLLEPLFVAYAVAHANDLGIQTVAYSVYKLHRGGGELCPKKIYERVREVIKQIINEIGLGKFKVEKEKVKNIKKQWAGVGYNYISGKDYIIPLLHERLKAKVYLRDTKNQILPRLARLCSLEIDPGLVLAINAEIAQ